MRVGIFHSTLPEEARKTGGVELFVHRFANALVDRGHGVFVYTLACRAPSGARYVLRRIGRPQLSHGKLGRLAIVPALLNRIGEPDLDVLNLHGDDWFYVRRRVATVRTFHGSAKREAQSATSAQRKALQSVIFPCELVASRLATASYTVCAGMPRGYRLSGMLPQGGGLFPSMVDLPPTLTRFAHPTVLFIGTWGGRKRGRMLRDVFESDVRRRHPTAQLLMVSDQCEESECVRWIRSPDDRALSELLARSWLFCLPSTYEGFGQPYVEAMAHGTPVVATPNPGIDFISSQGRAAAVVDDRDLGDTLASLLGDPQRREQLSAVGLQRSADFGWDRACEAHEGAFAAAIHAYEQANKQRRGRPGMGTVLERTCDRALCT